MWKRTLAGFSVQAWQQLSGANIMTYYVVYIFYMANLEGNVNLISSGVQYALFIIFSTIMFFFVDKIGRRTLLVWGAVAMGFCHFVVGGVLGANYTYVPGKWSWFPSCPGLAAVNTFPPPTIIRWKAHGSSLSTADQAIWIQVR